jgi:hypothetical protein
MHMAKGKKIQQPTGQMVALLKQTGSPNRAERHRAMKALAQALTEPLRQGVLSGDIIGDIFAVENLDPGATAEYPLDFYQPGMEGQYTAYSLPTEGTIPLRHIGGDVVTIQTYDVGNSIDWLLKYSRQARWNIVARAMEVLEAGVTKKLNTDGWRVLIAAAVGRGVLVYDNAAAAGQFTKRLVSLMKTSMRRTAGGNSASEGRGRVTDLFLSPEGLEDIREWDADEVDETTRREIFTAEDGVLSRIYGVNLHDIDELGENQEFQKYFAETLGGSMGASDKEIVVGLDLSKNDSFVMPVKEQLTVFDDPQLHRRRRAGVYCWMEVGFAALDPRRILVGSF